MTMSSETKYTYSSPTGKNFQANICSNSIDCYWGSGGSIAALYDGDVCEQSLAKGDQPPTVESLDRNTGITLTYNSGDLCDGTAGVGPTQTKFIVKCDGNIKGGVLEHAGLDPHDSSRCSYEFTFRSKAACLSSSPLDIITGPQYLSQGSRFLILLGLATTAYVMLGILINRRKNEDDKSFTGNFPHKEFWADLPDKVKEGFAYSISKLRTLFEFVRGKFAKSDSEGYDNL